MSTAKRDFLANIEQGVQERWEKERAFEVDAPESVTDPRYFINFPYPYMNGSMHLGHTFSASKCEFMAGYQRLKGKKVLFPFGFHCTGMPIKACADKLKREFELYGNPPVFPKAPEAAAPAPAAEGAAASTSAAAAAAPAAAEDAKKVHAKILAKSGDEKYQYNILKKQGIPEADIPKFQDPDHWLRFFPAVAKHDLTKLGIKVDWRRSFITTPANPFYDSFVCWQFNTLYKRGYVKFGKRPTIYSIRDKQPCMDHDRASGEGVGVQEYTLIKLQLVEPLPESLASLSGRKVFLVAGTLRPETMYGQTNCWVKPTMQYGAYEVDATTKDVFICTERAALNLAYQDLSSKEGEAVKVGSVSGQDLVGRLVQAPLSKYGQVYVLPMLSIKEDKGTGIVTSVPSDSPDDYAALRDLRNKEAFRQKYGIKDEMVLPFEPVPIIRTPTMGDLAAVKACDEFKVASQNDAVQLAAAKEKVYREGFYEGVFIFGPHNGGKVQDVKPIVRQQLLDEKLAAVYYEPENKVMSRSGDECIVAKVDQWYLDYGMQSWKDQVKVALRQLETYNPDTLKQFEITVDWLHDWACSRSYGLGSRIPWDQTYLIESLSDSTIYMAYYTVAHLLQNGALYGAGVSPLGITPEQMTHEVWDYIFFSKSAFPASSAIPQATLDKLRHEFQYWYGFNLRSSGRDLVQNHLTFSLFNHVAIWPDEPERWPKSIRANGHILLNNEKMSKQTGNFMTLLEGLGKFSADAMRMTLADAGDTADDANFSEQTANASVLRLFTQCEWIQATIAAFPTMRDEDISSSFADRYLDTAINRAIALADEAYAKMNFREALILGHYELFAARDFYREVSSAPNRRVLERFLEVSSILIAPICPHYAEHVFSLLGRKTLAINAPWPVAGAVDELTLKMARYISTTAHSFRARAQLVVAKGNKGKGPAVELKNLNGTIFYAKSYPAWQEHVIKTVAGLVDQSSNKTFPADNKEIMGHLKIKETPLLAPHTKNVMPFVAQLKLNYEALGASALDLTTPFDELQLLNDFLPYLLRSSEVQNLAVKSADEADAKTRDSVTPGNPVVNFA